ncbi:hypothetical protein SAMN05444365_101174 [Micromonospora pattaloongensis]|uniref:DNA-directed RNA polymerase specialized sigma subunit, sigma24 family n=1 Tax=Micromonospora pattaloongensis TaxID=405436 RepID=A0A1H3FXQ3_9ACTN|nr:hypothetical protein [Micromonospora pattaloongensis]SDX94899.1 hypothetical protein SAMN05444365_101174 [Micromonospora pattaloongensis]
MQPDRHESTAPTPAANVFVRHYDRLVRLAFLVAPAGRDPESRLARAHRLVQRCLPWRERAVRTERELLIRVLRRAARRSRTGWPSLRTWAWPAPVDGDRAHDAVVTALGAAPRAVRAAYVLLMVERLPARDAVVVLHEAGWPEGVAHVAAASALRQRLADEQGIPVDRQRALLAGPPADPTVVRLRAPDPVTLRVRRVARLGGAALAAVVALTVVATTLLGVPQRQPAVPQTVGRWATPEASPVAVRRIAARAWAGASELSVATWPARGTRTTDDELVRAAVGAWRQLAEPATDRRTDAATRVRAQAASGGSTPAPLTVAVSSPAGRVTVTTGAGAVAGPPVGTPQLLYAGELDGATVAVLADQTRIATYTLRGGARGLRVEPTPLPEADTGSALRLGPADGPARYLVAPWVTRVETRTADGRGWRPLRVAGGVSDPVPAGARGCGSGPLLRLRSAEVDRTPFLLADLGGTALARLRYLPPTADPAGDGADELDPDGGAGLWSRLGCPLAELRGTAPESATAWELWRGRLPGTTGTSRLVCLRAAFGGGGNRVAAVLLAPERAPSTVAAASGTRLCSRLAPDVAVAWWWRAPTGAWHHLAVGGGAVETVEVTIDGRTRRGGPLVVSGPYPTRPTAAATVRATARDGDPVPVLN